MSAPARVVLDTNVVLSSLLFGGGLVSRIRTGWQAGRFVPLASSATVAELMRVLAYSKFKLAPADQEELLADYLPWVRVVRVPDPPPAVPACGDPFDASFLQLAVADKAHALVSGDRALLALAGTFGACAVLTAADFCERHLTD